MRGVAARLSAMISLISSLAFAAWTMAIAVCDCRSRRVPNALVGAGFCVALVASLFHAGPASLGLLPALAAAAVGLAALMPFFMLGMMGAGDVKVFAVLGAWCGMSALLDLWVVASLIALVYSLAGLLVSRMTRMRSHALAARAPHSVASGSVRASHGAPYAAFLTLPALAWLVIHMIQRGLQ
jgi:prepilin peptidase CpaA